MSVVADPDMRRRELAALHIAKKQLALDDDTWQQMLFTLERVSSSAELDQAGRRRVLEHLRNRGFTRASKPAQLPAPAGRKPLVAPDRQALIDEIERRLGARPWNYARAMASRMFKLQLEWCQPDQLRRLVAALEYDKRRKER